MDYLFKLEANICKQSVYHTSLRQPGTAEASAQSRKTLHRPRKGRMEGKLLQRLPPTHLRYEGEGVTINDVSEGEDELIFLAGFFDDTNQLRLIRRDGTVIVRWPVHFPDIFRLSNNAPNRLKCCVRSLAPSPADNT